MSDSPEDRYSVRVEWSEIDGEFKATCPAFPGLSAFGETREEAIEEANVALSMFIEDYREEGDELPAPREATEYSGQTRLRMPSHLHEALAREAGRQDVSLNTLMVTFLARQLGTEEKENRLEDLLLNYLSSLRVTFSSMPSTMSIREGFSQWDDLLFITQVPSSGTDYEGGDVQEEAIPGGYEDVKRKLDLGSSETSGTEESR